MLGALLFAAILARPDILYAVSMLARCASHPTPELLNDAERVLDYLDHLEPIVEEFDRLISTNEIFIQRLSGLVPVTGAEAIDYGMVGPNLRASVRAHAHVVNNVGIVSCKSSKTKSVWMEHYCSTLCFSSVGYQ